MYVFICMYIFLILTRFLAHGMQKACERQGRVLRWAEMSNEMSYLAVSEATIEPHRPAPRPRLCEAFVDGDIHGAWTSKASGRERAYTTGRLHLMELGGNSECCSTIGSLLPIPLFLARLPAILSAICLFRSSWRSFQALKWNFEKKFGIWQFFSEYLQKNLEFQLKKNNNVLKFPVLFFVTWFCFFKAMEKTQTIPGIFQFFLFFSFSFPGAPHKKPCQVIQSQKFPIWCQIFTPITTLFPSFHWFFSMVPRTCTKGVYGRLLKMKKSNSEHGCWKPQSTLLEEGSGQGQVSRRRQHPWPIRGTYDETCCKR